MQEGQDAVPQSSKTRRTELQGAVSAAIGLLKKRSAVAKMPTNAASLIAMSKAQTPPHHSPQQSHNCPHSSTSPSASLLRNSHTAVSLILFLSRSPLDQGPKILRLLLARSLRLLLASCFRRRVVLAHHILRLLLSLAGVEGMRATFGRRTVILAAGLLGWGCLFVVFR